MKRPLDQLRQLQKEHQCPIVCAGDLFHHWNCTPELINFALANVPEMYAVPGQHDLPHHNYADIKKSAYWTLVVAGVVKNLVPGKATPIGSQGKGLVAYGFPWGFMPDGKVTEGLGVNLAVIHHYVWQKGFSYPGALQESHINKLRKFLKNYDAAIFGDNHKGFLDNVKKPQVLNCGAFLRRISDEINYKPRVGLLYSDGTIKRAQLDTSQDVMIRTAERETGPLLEASEFIAMLQDVGAFDLDFSTTVKRYMQDHKISGPAKRIITEMLEDLT